MYMIDYLNAVFPAWGVFPSEEDAWTWIKEFGIKGTNGRGEDTTLPLSNFTVFEIGVNFGNVPTVEHTAPNRRYANQR